VSIQNRLLLVYTTIFTVAFILFALIVYLLPSNRILAEVDRDLEALAAEVRLENAIVGRNGFIRFDLPDELANLETASTFMLITDASGNIIAHSPNLAGFQGLLDPRGFSSERQFSEVYKGETLLRVLTVPLRMGGEDGSETIVYLQVARLLDSYESFNRFLIIALFIGLAAVTASLFLAVLLTPSSFKPLEDIAAVARQITNADDLSRRVPDTGRTDEIGVLARAFNQSLERLERVFQTQQRLLADVSHELRTPLTAIRGNVDLMRRMGGADPESLAIIQEEVERMTRLVDDLLLLARADAGGLPLERKSVELDTIFLEVYRQVSLLEKSVEVSIEDVDQACVLGDADRLKQLLLNLVDNAVKYTPPGGHVTLSLSKVNGWASIHIADTGVGIPPEDLPYIFDRFYRVDKARNRGQGGSGLGLSIAKWIAKVHGGDIEVISQVGQGTTFTVILPLYEEKQPVGERETEKELGKTRPSLPVLGAYRRR
jgi:signal transduction histidine kinase